MATAHYNLQSYSMGMEFATELKGVSGECAVEYQRLKKALKDHPNVPELKAQMQEVQKLLEDLREGLSKQSKANSEHMEPE